MLTDKPIKYVAHPVSAEDKAAIIAEGYRIIDIRFKPDAESSETVKEVKPKRKKKAVKKVKKS